MVAFPGGEEVMGSKQVCAYCGMVLDQDEGWSPDGIQLKLKKLNNDKYVMEAYEHMCPQKIEYMRQKYLSSVLFDLMAKKEI
jgi:hypothetical protein